MMKIKDLQPKQGNINIELDILEKQEQREFEKFGKQGRVCNAIGQDNTGKIKITLWNEQIEKVNPGDKVRFENSYVNEFKGDMQITTGKFGSFEVIGKSETVDSPITEKNEAEEELVE
ncbi:MAG: hypothetical protein ACQESF_03625 [Nanobdellota archaeon]